jgi:hypothetical protein
VREGQTVEDIIRLLQNDNPPHALIKVGDMFGFPMIHYIWILGYDEESGSLAYRDPSGGNGRIHWMGIEAFEKQWQFQGGYSFDTGKELISIERPNGTAFQVPSSGLQIPLNASVLPAAAQFFADSGQGAVYNQHASVIEAAMPFLPMVTGGSPLEILIRDFPVGSCFGRNFEARGGSLITRKVAAPQADDEKKVQSQERVAASSESEDLAAALALSLKLAAGPSSPDDGD